MHDHSTANVDSPFSNREDPEIARDDGIHKVNFNIANVSFAALDTIPVFAIAATIVLPIYHLFSVGIDNKRVCNRAEISSRTNDGRSMEFHHCTFSSTHSQLNTTGFSLRTGSFSWVVSIVVQDFLDRASLDDRPSFLANQFLDTIEEQMIELLPR